MATIKDLCAQLDAIAPPTLAEDWDNTGLLLGDPAAPAARVMTCLTLTRETAREAVDQRADLVVSHHPLPFRPVARITADSCDGRLLWEFARAGVAVYSPHTAFDSAAEGVNAALAAGIGIEQAAPLAPHDETPVVGGGRVGRLAEPATLDALAQRVGAFLRAGSVRVVGDAAAPIQSAAVACGSGGSFIPLAAAAGAGVLVTGEATFHNCLAARASGLALILPGHYASERFALELLANRLGAMNPSLSVWASRDEADPLRTL